MPNNTQYYYQTKVVGFLYTCMKPEITKSCRNSKKKFEGVKRPWRKIKSTKIKESEVKPHAMAFANAKNLKKTERIYWFSTWKFWVLCYNHDEFILLEGRGIGISSIELQAENHNRFLGVDNRPCGSKCSRNGHDSQTNLCTKDKFVWFTRWVLWELGFHGFHWKGN